MREFVRWIPSEGSGVPKSTNGPWKSTGEPSVVCNPRTWDVEAAKVQGHS